MHSIDDDIVLPTRQRHYDCRREDGTGHDGISLCAPCRVVCFLLCLTKMKTRSRITLTWFYVIICACVSGGLVAKYHQRNELTASPRDMRKIDMVSPTFCESVTVKSSAPIDIIKFFKPPEIKNSFSKFSYRRVSTTLSWNEYQYWGFYLLKGSKMTAHVCGRAYLHKIVGKDKLNKWIDGSDRKISDGSPIVNDCTLDMYKPTVVDITATKSAQYYFLFSFSSLLGNEKITNVVADFIIYRKYYGIFSNVSTTACTASTVCTVSLAPETQETVVYFVPYDGNMEEVSVVSSCKPRVYMYILIFGLLPCLIGGLFTCIILKFSYKRNRERERREPSVFTVSQNEDNRLTNSFTNPNFHVQLSPPSYEEIQTTSFPGFSEAPPSYDEAVGDSAYGNNNHNNNDDNNNNNNKDNNR